MKIVHTQTKWGNLYRNRYFIGGKRVTEAVYDETLRLYRKANPSVEAVTEMCSGIGPDYRAIYVFPDFKLNNDGGVELSNEEIIRG